MRSSCGWRTRLRARHEALRRRQLVASVANPPRLMLPRKDRRIVLRRARRRRQVPVRAEDDLIQRQAVFANLNADGLRAGRREVHGRGKRAVGRIRPAPAGQAGIRRLFDADRRRRRRADADTKARCALSTDCENCTNTESFAQRILVRLAAQPQVICDAGLGLERQIEVVRRSRERRGELRGARIRVPHADLPAAVASATRDHVPAIVVASAAYSTISRAAGDRW